MADDVYLVELQGLSNKGRHAANIRNSPHKDGTPKVRKVDPLTTDIDYTPDQIEFSNAVEAYKTRTGRRFPSNHEILSILRSLGYQKLGMNA